MSFSNSNVKKRDNKKMKMIKTMSMFVTVVVMLFTTNVFIGCATPQKNVKVTKTHNCYPTLNNVDPYQDYTQFTKDCDPR